MLAGDVLEAGGRGGTGGGDTEALNGDGLKPGLKPVGLVCTEPKPGLKPVGLVCTAPKWPLCWKEGVEAKPPKLPPGIPVGWDNIGPIEGKPVGCCIIGWGLLGNPVTCAGIKDCCGCAPNDVFPGRVGTNLLKAVVVGIRGCNKL
jgi:hypothetical protein